MIEAKVKGQKKGETQPCTYLLEYQGSSMEDRK